MAFLLAAARSVMFGGDIGAGLSTLENDDAMRLVQVRDLLAGQGWFDQMQYRLGTAAGTLMHWSRLVDAPIAGLILALTPWLGPDGAETWAIAVWPVLLLLPTLAAIAIGGRALAGLLGAWLAALAGAAILGPSLRFAPGVLDHHNLQIMLVATLVAAFAAGPERPRVAALAGLAVATSVAIGIEMLVQVGIVGIATTLLWAMRGEAMRAGAVAFSLALGIGLAVLFAASAPPGAWQGGFCDALSIDLAVPVLTGAAAFGMAAHLGSGLGRGARLGLAALALGLAGGAAAATGGACFASPVAAIDPVLRTLWLDRVVEALSLPEALAIIPDSVAGYAACGAIATGAALWLALRGPAHARATGLMTTAALGISLALTVWLVRNSVALIALAPIVIGAASALLYRRSKATDRPGPGLAAIAIFFFSVPLVWTSAIELSAVLRGPSEAPVATAVIRNTEEADVCSLPGSYDALAALPAGVVSGSWNLGPQVLRFTPHRVLAAPYHRNVDGLMTEFAIALAPADEAEALIRAAGVDYVIACSADVEYDGTGYDGPAFARRLDAGEVPAFLEPVPQPVETPLRVYRVVEGEAGQ